MGLLPSPRLSSRHRRAFGYGLAVVLPLLSSALTQHVGWLKGFPYALYFLSMALVAAIGGVLPAMLGFLVTIISRSAVLGLGFDPTALNHSDRLRSAFLFCNVLIIGVIAERRVQTERNLETAHNDLKERTDALIETLNSSKCACWTLDLDAGRSARWYSGSYQVFGRPFAEIEAHPSLGPFLHPDDQPRLIELRDQMRSNTAPIVFEYRCPWPNGELHWLEMRGTRVPGTSCRWRGVTLDITERRVAEAALLRAEKLAAMGRLASTVAHEINNPLEAVTNLLYLSLQDAHLSPETRTFLNTADNELSRLGNITRLTLGFVRNSGERQNVEVAAVVEDVLAIFRHRFEVSHADIQRDYVPGVTVCIAPHELRQVITNLIANAADAVAVHAAAGEGRIRISVFREGPLAVLAVEDNGVGIADEHLQRIFEPFFSTKQEVGTGIGLWVSRELAEKNGGRITVNQDEPSPGTHTRFRVEFPLAPQLPVISTGA